MKTTQPTPKQQTVPACPACSHTRGTTYTDEHGNVLAYVYVCGACDAIHSDHIYQGDSYGIVLPQMVADGTQVPAERLRYFDFSGVGSNGTYRRHGWFDTQSKRIVQVG